MNFVKNFSQWLVESALGNIEAINTKDRNQVIALQNALLAAGENLGTSGPNKNGVDGQWGGKTYAAVQSFQRKNNLKPDGIPGKNTVAALKRTKTAPKLDPNFTMQPPSTAPASTLATGLPAQARKLASVKNPGQDMAKKYEGHFIYISGGLQRLYHYNKGFLVNSYRTSTGKAGFGNEADSGKTPTGLMKVTSKFGEGLPKYALITNRKGVKSKSTGEYITLPKCDETSRKIAGHISRLAPSLIKGWLPGEVQDYLEDSEACEAHVLTRGLTINNARSIYIHGTNYEKSLGTPLSGGCVRINNDAIIELHKVIPVGTPVYISADEEEA